MCELYCFIVQTDDFPGNVNVKVSLGNSFVRYTY